MTIDKVMTSLNETTTVAQRYFRDSSIAYQIVRCSGMMADTLMQGLPVIACGNGGSYTHASHLTQELVGYFNGKRRPLNAIALGEPGALTCIANDAGYAEVFARQLEAHTSNGGMFIGISTSGNSANVIRAVDVAEERKLPTVLLLGESGGELRARGNVAFYIPSSKPMVVQDIHHMIMHRLIECTEGILRERKYI